VAALPRLPDPVLAFAERGPAWAAYVDALPGRLADLVEEWSLRAGTELWWGETAVVLPVRDPDGSAAVLKVAFPDEETEHEALALQHWAGHGAVRLRRADPRRRALLLDRLERTDLGGGWDVADCEQVAALYPLLHVAAPPRLRRLSEYVGRQVEPLRALPPQAPLPRRMVEQCLSLIGDLAGDERCDGVLVHGDLHYANVLATGPDLAQWVAIDPKPLSGDAHWEPAPLLWNRWDELAGDVRGGVRRRFHAVVDAAGLDEDRAVAWTVVRQVLGVLWVVQDAVASGSRLGPAERDHVTRLVSVAKAVQE
jgi:streptomycin 6-kinase